jgi:hypothetical protein
MDSPRSDNELIDEASVELTEKELKTLETVGDYKHGSIKWMKLTNFLTYSAVEFSPKPR